MKIHEDDCRFFELTTCRDHPAGGEHGEFGPCTCTAEAKLRELVEAADDALNDMEGLDGGDRSRRLDAALQPFRERPDTMNRPGNIG